MNRKSTATIKLVVWVSTGSIHRRGSRYYVRDGEKKPRSMNKDQAADWASRFNDDCNEGRARLLDICDEEIYPLLDCLMRRS